MTTYLTVVIKRAHTEYVGLFKPYRICRGLFQSQESHSVWAHGWELRPVTANDCCKGAGWARRWRRRGKRLRRWCNRCQSRFGARRTKGLKPSASSKSWATCASLRSFSPPLAHPAAARLVPVGREPTYWNCLWESLEKDKAKLGGESRSRSSESKGIAINLQVHTQYGCFLLYVYPPAATLDVYDSIALSMHLQLDPYAIQ